MESKIESQTCGKTGPSMLGPLYFSKYDVRAVIFQVKDCVLLHEQGRNVTDKKACYLALKFSLNDLQNTYGKRKWQVITVLLDKHCWMILVFSQLKIMSTNKILLDKREHSFFNHSCLKQHVAMQWRDEYEHYSQTGLSSDQETIINLILKLINLQLIENVFKYHYSEKDRELFSEYLLQETKHHDQLQIRHLLKSFVISNKANHCFYYLIMKVENSVFFTKNDDIGLFCDISEKMKSARKHEFLCKRRMEPMQRKQVINYEDDALEYNLEHHTFNLNNKIEMENDGKELSEKSSLQRYFMEHDHTTDHVTNCKWECKEILKSSDHDHSIQNPALKYSVFSEPQREPELQTPRRSTSRQLHKALFQESNATVLIARLYHSGDFDTMIHLLTQDTKCINELGIAQTQFGLALAYYGLKDYDSAVDMLLKCLHQCSSSAKQSEILFYLGEVSSAQYQPSAAIEWYRKSIEVHQPEAVSSFKSTYDLEEITLCCKWHKLGSELRFPNRIAESVQSCKTAVSCGDATLEDLIRAYSTLGNVLHNNGDFRAAAEAYENARSNAEKLGDNQSLCWIYGNLGNSYLGLGRKAEGINCLEKALQLTQKHDGNPSAISRAFNNLGTGYQSIGDVEKAEDCYDQALCHGIFGEDVNGQARVYGNIGNLCMLRKDYERAIPHYTEALDVSNDSSVISIAHHNRGCAYYELAEKRKKEQLISKRCYFEFLVSGEGKMNTAKLSGELSILYKQGLTDLEHVISIHESKFSNIRSSLQPKNLDLFVCLFESNTKTFARAQDCAYCLGDHHKALLLAEQCHSRTLSEFMLSRESSCLDTPLHSPVTLDQVVSIMHLQEPNVPVVVLSWTGNRLIGWILVFDGKEVRMNTFEQEPSEDIFDGKSLDVYLQYYLGQLLSGDLELFNPVSRESNNHSWLESEYKRPEMEEGNTTDDLIDGKEIEKMSPVNKLAKLVTKPIIEINQSLNNQDPSKQKKIVLITDSTTKLIPFASLGEDDSDFFGDEYVVRFMPSLLTLGILSQTPPVVIQIPSNNDICIVGDPVTPPFTVSGREWNLGPLPHSKEEAEWVGHYVRTKPLLQKEPTKDVVISKLKQAKLIHVATHGSASKGFLVLAGNTYDTQTTLPTNIAKSIVQDADKLLLYASDVESLSLSAGLVVLSSCDSSRGAVKGDDIQGMTRAFLLAGAQSVMTSLWKVPDKSARFFMQFFYRFMLDGLTSSEALSKASASIRAFDEFSSMIHWSGYQITGKDVTVEVTISDEERSLRKILGRKCSPFPRLEILASLKTELIKDKSSDIQIISGSSDVFLLEPIVDFALQNCNYFPGGVFWVNGSNKDLICAQCKIVEKVMNMISSPLLIIVDTESHELMEEALKRVQDYSKASIIMKLPCDSGKYLEAQLGSRKRLFTVHDVSALTDIQVTQHLVYYIQHSYHLTAGKEEQKALSYLSFCCFGSPFITQMICALIDKYIVKYDCPKKGIKQVWKELEHVKYTFGKIGVSSIVVYSILNCLSKEQFLSTPSIILLRCLSLCGSRPIPQSFIVAISEEIVACHSNGCSVLPSEVWSDLCTLSLLHSYPSLSLPNNSDLSTTQLYYVPEIVTETVLATILVANDIDTVVCATLVYSAVDKLLSRCLTSNFSSMDCMYFPEIIDKFRGLVSAEDLYTLEGLSLAIREHFLSCL